MALGGEINLTDNRQYGIKLILGEITALEQTAESVTCCFISVLRGRRRMSFKQITNDRRGCWNITM